MEIRGKLTIIFIAFGSFISGIMVNDFTAYAELDCAEIPTFHTIYLKRLVECLNGNTEQLSDRLDATNDVFFKEIERLDKEIDNATRTNTVE